MGKGLEAGELAHGSRALAVLAEGPTPTSGSSEPSVTLIPGVSLTSMDICTHHHAYKNKQTDISSPGSLVVSLRGQEVWTQQRKYTQIRNKT